MNIVIFGATGMLGQSVLRECLLAGDVSRVITVGRTPVPQQDPKLAQVTTADLADPSVLDGLRDIAACFFCLGVTAAGMDEARYRQLTLELTLQVAEGLLANNPGMRFVYVSGAGADSTEQGKVMWARVRGATENALQRLPFAATCIFRPAIIQPLNGVQSKTASYRLFYRVARPFFPLMHRLSRSVLTSEEIGQAMLNVARFGQGNSVLEAPQIRELAHRTP